MSDKDEIKPKEVTFPPSVREAPKNKDPVRSLQEFVKRTGFLYKKNPNDNLADPFAALSIMPGRTADMKDLSAVRGQFPDWTPTNCDECGACYTACPDNALLGLVNTVEEVIATNIAIIEKNGQDAKLFKKHVKTLAEIFRSLSKVDARATTTALLFREAVDLTVEKTGLPEQEKKILETQGALFLDAMGGFKFLPTKSGGLFSITVDPWKCKGCMLCEEADVCGKGGITAVTETEEDTARMKKMWDYQRKLPSTNPGFCRISNLNEGAGCLESLLLDKDNVKTYGGGSGTCVGCGEQEPIRLLTATVSALMKPRVNVHIDHLKNLVSEMEAKIEGFVGAANMRSEDALQEIVNGMNPEDYEWYLRGTDTLGALKDLVWKYTEGVNGRGRSDMMVANATGCSSVAGATWPFTPFLFPWMNNLFQDSATVAANLFTGHMDKMADGFKAVRTAELIVAGETDKTKYDFTYFGWKDFTEEEFLLCPPIVAVGGDGAMYDIGFQNVSRVLASGIPVKIFVLDTGAYSNTGGQNCTSGFKGQIADLAPFGAFRDGKQEVRKELALLAMGHRTSYVYQGSTADSGHLISGLIEGLNYRGPSLFNIYCACPPEHIIADNAGVAHSKMARNSRAYPQFKFYPDEDKPWSECLSLEGNPDTDEDWPTYDLSYKNKYGKSLKMKCKFTFADFASKEGRFKDHFTREKADLWTPELVPLSDYLDVPKTEREGLVPYIFGTDEKENLIRILPKKIMVESCADRKSFWRLLKELAGISKKTENVSSFNEKDLREQIRKEELAKFMAKFAGLLAGEGVSLVDLPAAPKETSADNTVKAKESTGEKTVTIDTDDCTVCEKCFEVNKKVFGQREEDGKAVVLDPKGGTFAEIVKAAEQCTGGLIHPGTPQNPNEKNMEKLLKRAEKYQQ